VKRILVQGLVLKLAGPSIVTHHFALEPNSLEISPDFIRVLVQYSLAHTQQHFQQLASEEVIARAAPPVDVTAHALLRAFQLELFSHAQHNHVTASIASTYKATPTATLDALIHHYVQTMFTESAKVLQQVLSIASNQHQSLSDPKLIEHIKTWLECSTVGTVLPSLLLLLSARINAGPERYEHTLIPLLQQLLSQLDQVMNTLKVDDSLFMLLSQRSNGGSTADTTTASMKVR
jgi:hypothetical protein